MAKRSVALVIGGGGFIGANLVRRLLKERCDVHLTMRRTTDLFRIRDIKNHLTLHAVSLNNSRDLSLIMQKLNPSLIFHLAAHGSNSYETDVREIVETNVTGTLNLLLASRDVPYEAFINTGTSSEYGFKSTPMRESDLLEPVSFYAAAKASTTLLASVFAKMYQKPIVTLRPFSVYGSFEDPRRFIPTIVRNLIKGNPIQLTAGTQRRDFIYIDDVVEAYMKVAMLANKLQGKILNLGTGKQYANDEVVRTLFRVTGKRVPIEKGAYPKRVWDTPHWVADMSQTKRLLGWRPKYSLEEGLRKTYEWYKA